MSINSLATHVIDRLFDRVIEPTVTVWYLRRTQPPGPALNAPFELLVMDQPDPRFFRQLYTDVGGPWLWWERRAMTDGQIAALFADETRFLIVPQINRTPVGFAEVQWIGGSVLAINFFGLKPEWTGKGLGRAFMSSVLNTGWKTGVLEAQLNTCSLDHPGALSFYKRNGFSVYHEQTGPIMIPRRHLDLSVEEIKERGLG